jgi:hypothetical protein
MVWVSYLEVDKAAEVTETHTMEAFLTKHADLITATLSCFDRLIFKGYLPLGHGDAMEGFLGRQGVLLKHFGAFVQRQAQRLKEQAKSLAEAAGRPLRYLNGYERKEAIVDQILKSHPLEEGLICVLSAVETAQSFRLAWGEGRPRLERSRRKCLCYYFYYQDPVFGRIGIRLQTWFPLTIQVYLNGHDWLARALAEAGLDFVQEDNSLVALADPARAQALADQFVRLNWPDVLKELARRVNPLLADLLQGMEYYWVVDQAEFSTDVLFKDAAKLGALYADLLRQATLSFGAEEVMTFLGRKLSPQFQGEVQTHSTRRAPGARIKHRMKENWIKMYNKAGVVLRVETVINHPYEFRVRRRGKRQGQEVMGWFPLTKGVKHLWRYREVMVAANGRYLEALGALEHPAAAQPMLERVCEAVNYRGRRRRGINPLRGEDRELFKAVLRGEHVIHGLRNRDLARSLGWSQPQDLAQARRQSARVTRKLHLLHAHGLIAKIPRSRRWRVTARGAAVMGAAIHYREQALPVEILRMAA